MEGYPPPSYGHRREENPPSRHYRSDYDDRNRHRDRDRNRDYDRDRSHRSHKRDRHRDSSDRKHKKRKRSHSSRRRSDSRDSRRHKKKKSKHRRRSDSGDSMERYYTRLMTRVNAGIPTKFHAHPDPNFTAKYMTPQEKLEEYKMMNPDVDTTVHNKTDRQLYVGNLPPDITIPVLVKHLNDAMYALNLCEQPEDRPIVDAWISSDGHYAFVEFRTIRDAHLGFNLTQIAIHGHALKVGRPRIANSSYAALAQQMNSQSNYDNAIKINQNPGMGMPNHSAMAASSMNHYNQFDTMLRNLSAGPQGADSNPSAVKSKTITITKLLVSNLPLDFNKDQVKEILSIVGPVKEIEMITDPNNGKYRGEVYVQYEREEDSRKAETTVMGMNIKDAFLHVKKVQSTTMLQEGSNFGGLGGMKEAKESNCLVLINLVIPEEVKDVEEYTEVEDETFEEMERYGKVEQVVAPKPTGGNTKGVGKVFVKFSSISEATVGKKAMEGRRFEGRVVEAYFYPAEKFDKYEFE